MSTTGIIAEIQAERERQKSAEGWGESHDDNHNLGEIAMAAAAYAINAANVDGEVNVRFISPNPYRTNITSQRFKIQEMLWPWSHQWWKPKDRRRDLLRAAALIVAEIERLDRAAAKETPAP